MRRALAGERLETLDHVERELTDEMLLIADRDGPIGIAGVMGGATSEVSDATTDVAIESAIFDPVSIRRTAQRLALRSEASSRFEKGQEPRLARIGADRTAQLVQEWAGGVVARGRVDTAPDEPGPSRVTFRPARINRLLGTELSADEQRDLLSRVGIETEPAPGEPVTVALRPEPLIVDAPAAAPGEAPATLAALVPTWRRDVSIEADVAEEIARVRGYELTPSVTPDTSMPVFRPSPLEVRELVRETLAGAGLTEIVTTALVSPRHLEIFALTQPRPVRRRRAAAGRRADHRHEPALARPLGAPHDAARQPARRRGHQPSPRHRGRGGVRDRQGLRARRRRTAGVVAARVRPGRVGGAAGLEPPRAAVRPGRREGPARAAGPPARTSAVRSYRPESGEAVFHPGRTARAEIAGRLHALVGELHPSTVEAWELRTGDAVIVGEVAIEGLAEGRLTPERAPAVGRHPEVERDLAIVVAEATPAASVEAVIRGRGGELLRDARLFDIYRGTPLAGTEKSLAFRLRLGAERTLTEAEVEAAVAAIVDGLSEVGGRLRA